MRTETLLNAYRRACGRSGASLAGVRWKGMDMSRNERQIQAFRAAILARDEEQRKVIDLQDRICKKYYARIKELEAQIETWQEILNLP
jgi:hypothetical protein